MKTLSRKSVFSLLLLLAFQPQANAEESSEKSAANIAAELANPNTILGTMNFNLDYIAFDGKLPGANDQNALRLTFQPSLPYPMENGLNFFARPAIPVIINQDVPYFRPTTPVNSLGSNMDYNDTGLNLGDIGFDVGMGKTFSNGLVAIGGIVGTLPTATDDALGKDQWALGPEALIAVVKPWGAVGLLITHQWDVAGEDDFDTNTTAGQYFYTINLTDGWQIRSGPTFAYNHEAESGERFTFPIGIGINKTAILGKTPWKFGIEYWDYIESPDTFGPESQIRFVVAPVVPLPW